MKKPTKQDVFGAGVMLLLFAAAAVIDTYPLAAGLCVIGMAGCALFGKLGEVIVSEEDRPS